ncbi:MULTISPECIES: TRAP transporter small permease [Pyramidobacter]|uniref:TRAP transporter small permease n=1 Tax=Pyramidobacter TaxID=638847 RepID=UPI000EA0C171|nr:MULTISPECIES: TRAP transporter small permease subunit [Pyramidobacter]RKJ81139.1 TRAP transporter small permease subunit [Pyramidobacter sp. CG50-2]WOL39852.1 TRAP transporter small permease subunit [Pyramidobacter sp. YE332]BDF79481.1 hypothetical protein CE91St28_22750 [Pyramidobacter piscolens]
MKSMTIVRAKWIRGLDHVIDAVIVIALLAVTALMFVQVVMRYVLRSPLMGIEELNNFPTTWLYLMAAVKASSEKGQLVARVLEIFCKRVRSIYAIRIIASIASTVILCWLTWWGWDYLKYALRVGKKTDILFIPMIYYEVTVFIAFALMLFYTIVEMQECVQQYRMTPTDALVPKHQEVA